MIASIFQAAQIADSLLPPGTHFVPYLLGVICLLLSIIGVFSARLVKRFDTMNERLERHELGISRNIQEISTLRAICSDLAVDIKETNNNLGKLTREVDRIVARYPKPPAD